MGNNYFLNEIFYEDEDYLKRVEFCNDNNFLIEEIDSDEKGRRFQIKQPPAPTQEERKAQYYNELKIELAKIKEDIEQETFGLVREDYAVKKSRAAEIINELRVLEGKEPRRKSNENIKIT